MIFIIGGNTEGKVIGKYEDLFLSLSINSLFDPPPGVIILITVVTISIAPVEFFIESCIVFVAFYIGVTKTTLVISFTMSPVV